MFTFYSFVASRLEKREKMSGERINLDKLGDEQEEETLKDPIEEKETEEEEESVEENKEEEESEDNSEEETEEEESTDDKLKDPAKEEEAEEEEKSAEGDEEEEKPKEEEEKEEEEEQEEQEFNLEEQVFEIEGEEKTFGELTTEYTELKAAQEAIQKDEFLKGFIDYYQKTGNAKAYLESQTVNYDDMSTIDVLEKDFDERHEGLSAKGKKKLFKGELLKKYNLDLDGEATIEEDDVELGEELMELEAQKLKTKFKETQSQFAIPEASEKPKADSEIVNQPDIEGLTEIVKSNDFMKQVSETKTLKVKVGDGEFNLAVEDVDQLVAMTADPDKEFFPLFDNGKGGLNYEQWAEAVTFAKNPTAFKDELISHGRTLEREAYLKEARNTDGALSDKTRKDAKPSKGDGFMDALIDQHSDKL